MPESGLKSDIARCPKTFTITDVLIRYFRSFRLGLILAAASRANVLLQSSKII